MPGTGQLAMLILSIALFVIGGAISVSRIWHEKSWSRLGAKSCMWLAITVALGVLVWHSITRGSWLPLEDNFDALIWLALLLACFVMYVQRRRPIVGLDWFVMPIVVLMLIAAAIFGRTEPRAYVAGTWSWVHALAAYGGTAAFFIAGAMGLMYLVSNHRLRNKTAVSGMKLGSLERIEHITLVSVTLGFALLTVGLVTGLAIILHRGAETSLGPHWARSPKVLLTCAVWVVYALVLHAPLNPSFRGRRVAMLSILGFVLTVGTVIAVQFMRGTQ